MEPDLSELSVAEIRRRLLDQKDSAPPALLARLQKDPREGVRKIYRHLKNRREKEKAERSRIESMLNLERVLWNSGVRHIAGADEVGVGPLAGPVVAAAVVFPPGTFIPGVDDSKRLSPQVRQEVAQAIRQKALGIGVGLAEVAEIDELNVYHAGLLAMRRAVESLPLRPGHLLVDAREIPGISIPQNNFTKGDGLSFSIAAASIVAKTYRDQLMVELGQTYPQYGLARNKGYCTREHQEAIRRHGPCTIHRRSYTFIQELCGEYSDLFYTLRDTAQRLSSVRELAALEKEFEAVRTQLSPEEKRKLRLLLARSWSRMQPSEPQ
jgi:ribonuclease HII